MSARTGLLAAATALSLTGLVGTAGTTLAAPTLAPGQVQTVTVGEDDAAVMPLEADRLYPGAAASARFVVERGAFDGGRFALGIEQVEDLERECNRPERNSGDSTCGPGGGQGELSQQLLVGVAWAAAPQCSGAAPATSGVPMADLNGQSVLAPAELSEQDSVCVVLGLVLPREADNLVQTDLVRFHLRLGLDGAVPTEVLGTGGQRPTGPADDVGGVIARGGRSLTFTGSQAVVLALWGAVTMALGWVLVTAARAPRPLT